MVILPINSEGHSLCFDLSDGPCNYNSVAAFMLGLIKGCIGGSENGLCGRAMLWEARDS